MRIRPHPWGSELWVLLLPHFCDSCHSLHLWLTAPQSAIHHGHTLDLVITYTAVTPPSQFQTTISRCHRLKQSYHHIFTYSHPPIHQPLLPGTFHLPPFPSLSSLDTMILCYGPSFIMITCQNGIFLGSSHFSYSKVAMRMSLVNIQHREHSNQGPPDYCPLKPALA